MEITTENLPKELKSERRIQFTDCDSFGHLNNAAYINYFMNTREEQVLENYNFSFAKTYQKYKRAWVAGETRIVYLSPARYADLNLITTRIVQARKGSCIVEAVMSNQEKNALLSICSANFIWVDIESGRPRAHPPEIMEFINAVNNDLAPNGLEYFSERVKTLRNEFKNAATN